MNLFNRKDEPVRLNPPADPTRVRLNRWVCRNFGYLLLIITIISLLSFIGLCFWIIGGSALESGNYYNHLNDCVATIHTKVII